MNIAFLRCVVIALALWPWATFGEPIKLKPFDAVVQRATNHSWVNTGREPALLMCVMVGGK